MKDVTRTAEKRAQRYSVDQKSRDLAEYFLGDDRPEQTYRDLAQAIQDCVEDFCTMLENADIKAQEVRARLGEISCDADTVDFTVMLWGQRNPRICASNSPTGEHINYGGRRQP